MIEIEEAWLEVETAEHGTFKLKALTPEEAEAADLQARIDELAARFSGPGDPQELATIGADLASVQRSLSRKLYGIDGPRAKALREAANATDERVAELRQKG